ncbi:MAG: hypothetical protein H6885_04945 [Rhodobiaceae bacterium]|nr:hypothetical protein [Rhodobiaceae bacterium]
MAFSVASLRKRPTVFRALGRQSLPDRIEVGGQSYALIEEFKHDSWAATGLYENDQHGKVISKFNRKQPVFGVPMSWLGRWLAHRENWFLERLDEVDGIPKSLGPVSVDGKRQWNAIARSFVDGRPFTRRDREGYAFYDELWRLVHALHERSIAYVDLHKRENIIIDHSGSPHLVDFQVAFALTKSWPGNGWLARRIFQVLADMDCYHVRKHYAVCHSDDFSDEEREAYIARPGFVRFHRRFAEPLRQFRRRLLTLLRIRDKSGLPSSEIDAEAAFRVNRKED